MMNGYEMIRREFDGDLSPREHRSRIAAELALKAAAKSPIVAAAAVAAAALAGALHLGLLLLAPALAFALTFVLKLRSKRIARLADAHDDAKSISVPEQVWYSDPGAKEAIGRLAVAHQRLVDALNDSPRHCDGILVARLRGVTDIERRIVVLAARVEYLGLSLQRASVNNIETALRRIQDQENAARDDELRAARRVVIAQRETQLANARAIETRRQKLLISLDHMLSVLETLPLELTRLQLSTAEAADGKRPDPTDPTGGLSGELDAIEEVFAQRPTAE